MNNKKIVSKSLDVAGRSLSFEYGKFAQQATSAIVARYGDSVVFASVVIGREDLTKDYFPLSVEFQEKMYAGGRIKGSQWIKRERNTDEETLSARLIDRSIRPLFPKDFKNEVQVIVMVLATDTDNDTDVLGVNAVSAALAISPIPWAGPIAATRIGIEEGLLITNPKNGNRDGVELDLVVSSTENLVPMIEAGAQQVPEEKMIAAVKQAMAENTKIIASINELIAEVGKDKIVVHKAEVDPEFVADMSKKAQPLVEAYLTASAAKEGGSLDEIVSQLAVGLEDKKKIMSLASIVEDVVYKTVRSNLLDHNKRIDGRKLDEIRPLSAEVGVLPRVHGSGVFQRGQTQALTIATLGAPSLGQSIETAEGESVRHYMHHYNFPPFSTGETGKVGQPKRREIGHGALAERALAPVIPSTEVFPYAIRLVSEIMSSNGSTSMASTCGSTLALMDAGVPILAPVAGISTGLVTSADYPAKASKYLLLTDIIGLEDHYTDMDFKVAGTKDGITAIQLDTKVDGLTFEIIEETFKRAKIARAQVMDVIMSAIDKPRTQVSQFAPKIFTAKIPVDKIGELIGPGGKNIKRLMADFNAVIDVNDDGSVYVSGTEQTGVDAVLAFLQDMGREIKVGEVYDGTVANIMPFGAFVTILPNRDGLVHVSQMAQGFVQDPSTIVQIGQAVKVWVTEVDVVTGKIGLSMIFDEAGNPLAKAREERAPRTDRPAFDRGGRGGDRGGSRGPFNAPRRDDRRRF